MKWVDYRKKLGIGFEDKEKAVLLSNRLSVLIDLLEKEWDDYEDIICRSYFIEVCEKPNNHYAWYEIQQSIDNEKNATAFLSKAIALTNCLNRTKLEIIGKFVEKYILNTLDTLDIPYDLIRDNDGLFVFPKGAKELNDGNVNIPFEWLQNYPEARKEMSHALKEYSNSNNYSNIADLFRKALETFFRCFFESSKSLENLKTEYGQFMRDHGVPKELSNNFETVLQMYTNFNNSYAKHADKTNKEWLEFIMYQTGNIIRFMISLKNASDRN